MPRPVKGQDLVQTYVRLPKRLREALEAARLRRKQDFVVVVEEAVEEWLAKYHPDLWPPRAEGQDKTDAGRPPA